MRNGFKLTLMVAIALMGMRASAMVPTINPIPDVIVGDSDGVSGTDEFVFPDALNLDNLGNDPDDGPQPLVWTYEGTDDKYTFNGVAGLAGAESPVTPPAAKSLTENDDDPAAVDTNPATVTIRNADLSPIGGPNTDPGAPGIVDSETRTITLWASDGATAGQREVTIYTDNEGQDRLSSSEEFVAAGTFDAGAEGWTWAGGGSATSSSNNSALCITVPDNGVNDGQWISPYGLFELTDGSVYIGRFNLTTSQSALGETPLTIILFENDSNVAFEAGNLYYLENYFLDNFGGANAPGGSHPAGEEEHTVLFNPAPMSTQEWQDAAFDAGNAAFMDGRLRFRILDVDGAGYNAEIDNGSVCLQDYTVHKVDVSAMSRTNTAYNVTNLTGEQFVESTLGVAGSQTNFNYSGGNLTITPQDGNWEVEIAAIFPGDGVLDVAAGTGLQDDYPVAWTADDQYFEVAMEMSAANAAGENNPPDYFRIGLDAPTQEFIGMNWTTAARVNSPNSFGMPNVGTPQLYRAFFAPNNVTVSPSTDNDRLRPRFDMVMVDNIGYGVTPGTNAGGITIHSFSVYEVTY